MKPTCRQVGTKEHENVIACGSRSNLKGEIARPARNDRGGYFQVKMDFIQEIHKKTKRDYLFRVRDGKKAQYAMVAKEFGFDYWDGDRVYCYGGYYYDGRWRTVAEKMAEVYNLTESSKVLDVGCGKGFMLYEFTKILPGIEVVGFDISHYAIDNSIKDIKNRLFVYKAQDPLPFEENYFDLVLSINVLHNLYIYDFKRAIQNIERVGQHKYIALDSYRNEIEKDNLLNWQTTCELFFTPEEWEFLFKEYGYTGDWEFIFFE